MTDAEVIVLQDKYNPDEDHIVTAASCTTNCLAPVTKVLITGGRRLNMTGKHQNF